MHESSFLQDLAVVMMVAGLVTLLFHRLKQPVILGYLLAGFIIGPFTPPFPLVQDMHTIETMANLGVVFLMFSLGLDFNLRKLHRVGPAALLIAVIEISAMMLCGYIIGSLFGWPKADCVFLGIMLALTSTMIVLKDLRDTNQLHTPHAELIAGTSLFDDIFVILVMVMLPGFAHTGSLPTIDVALMLSGLFIFLVAAVIIGLLVVPRLLRFIARHATDETMLIVSLGLCFGLALFAVKLHFSAALGAFLIGAIVAESRDAGKVTILTGPVRDMFCAVFFVAIGMQIDPAYLVGTLFPAAVILVVYLVVKVIFCSGGAFLAGADGYSAIRVGTHMAQVGEFSFILATLAASYGLISDRLYPLIVTVAATNAIVRPYLISNSDPIRSGIARVLPGRLVHALLYLQRQAAALRSTKPRRGAMRHVWSLVIQLILNMALIAGGFIIAGYVHKMFPALFEFVPGFEGRSNVLLWLAAVVILLPLFIATFRKMQAMAMMLSELMTGAGQRKRSQRALRSALRGTILGVELAVLGIMTLIVSAAIMPTWQTLLVLLVIVALLVFFYGRSFNRWYSEAKFALIATFNEPVPDEPKPEARPLPPQLKHALLESVVVRDGPHAGQLIRELQLRTQTGASIVALEREGQPVVNPGPDVELQVGDRLLLLGDKQQLADAVRLLKTEPGAPASGPS